MSSILTISDVATEIGVSFQTIRFWEKKGWIPKAKRLRANGRRIYSYGEYLWLSSKKYG